MCGRYSIHTKPQDQSVEILGHIVQPMFNIAPTDIAPIICIEKDEPALFNARWGLIPAWVKDIKKTKPYFNARMDNLAGNKVYASSISRRCLVPMAGFYEWASDNKREPWYFQADQSLFYVGGLWRDWQDQKGQRIRTYTILTTEPNEVVKPIHDRMPVIIYQGNHVQWLKADDDEAYQLAVTYGGKINAYRVNADVVNNPRNKSATCVQELNKI